MTNFVYQGSVEPAAPAAVERPFVQQCFDALVTPRWVTLLGPRAYGKTSGLKALREKLAGFGMQSVLIDLQRLPAGATSDYSKLLRWVATRVADQLGIDLVAPAPEDADDLESWLIAALPTAPAPISLLIDEAASISDGEVRKAFYRQLRGVHEARSEPRAPSLGRTLTVLFSGTFEPKELVPDDDASPFNVCERISPTDLTETDLHQLIDQTGNEQARPFIGAVLDAVAGHPALSQYLLEQAAIAPEARASTEFEAAVRRLEVGDNDHIQHLMTRVVTHPGLRAVAARCVQSEDGIRYVADIPHRLLAIVGFARLQDGHLRVRSKVLHKVGESHPQLQSTTERP